ncbi:MAG: sulfotransferase family protein [Crocinitomicaceae bacterium]|nr:sulfotransferase family protein [Crocinitomicaceae bacterium]
MKAKQNSKRLFLWSGPRNISTTLMYAFAQRSDTVVYDEPLYGAYLSKTEAKEYHPGAKEIIDSMSSSYVDVIEQMLGRHKKPVAFFKNMAHHLLDVDQSFLKEGMNIILTRDPKEMLPSFDKVISNPKIEDVGYKAHVDLVERLELLQAKYVVLDATLLLKNPVGVLKKLCQACGIAFDCGMLKWNRGPRPEDGIWAKYWYGNVHRSMGFQEYKLKTTSFPARLEPLLEECRIYYDVLKKKALK